ncbi:DUF222 domain-containing protein [Microbacterium fluvii]|uniref:DUF222 domain-containing protein n=1 Tax=Microbacterium fluvii TaxID=415215 RepID=A0ABW2HAP0_9MICO|nr:HNH endonuclease signature motif containing protein [Microbacterium fluvii]MCU4671559.1 HNH endonuclease [Microbacterium fluvii]
MTTPLADIADLALRADALSAGGCAGMDAGTLMQLTDLLGQIRRKTDAAQAPVAAELARQSRPELGSDSLAKKQGFCNATTLIAATTGTTIGDAVRIVQVGEGTAPRMQLSGVAGPAKHPQVAEALAAGRIGAPAAAAIMGLLDRVALRAGADAIAQAEQTLVDQAPGLTLNDLNRVLLRAEAWLDPDGVAPREEQLRADRYLHLHEDRTGMLVFSGKADPEHAAPIKAVVEALVGAELRAARDREQAAGVGLGGGEPDAVRRSIPQMQLDALAQVCAHLLDCDDKNLPTGGATVVVRLTLDDLQNGTGSATIDGLSAPISVSTARRMAAAGGIIPCVLGGDSEILDWGRRKRLFTRTQRLALAERDGGCAKCGAPLTHTHAHHINWWTRDHGNTNLHEGVLLCDSCHHQIHDSGWEIRITGTGTDAEVWFTPPVWIDPTQTPRLGGRKRYSFAA